MGKLIVKNIGMLATPEGKTARRGAKQGEIRVLITRTGLLGMDENGNLVPLETL